MANPRSPTKSPTSTSTQIEPGSDVRESLSQFIARILDQLSLSAWLPSGVLVFGLFLASQIALAGGDVGKAISQIGKISFSALILLVFGVVLATVITQAFEFEAIRFLEGFWGPGRVANWYSSRRCATFRKKRDGLEDDRNEYRLFSFAQAKQKLRSEGMVDGDLLEDLEALVLVHGNDMPDERRDELKGFPWKSFADPDVVRRFDEADRELQLYPVSHYRVMPTRLGNTLRSYEDRSVGMGGSDVETAVLRVYDRLPPSLATEHDNYRTRLDLYSSLVLVAPFVAIVGFTIVVWVSVLAAFVYLAAGLTLGLMSYRAAVRAAEGYGVALVAIHEWDETHPE